MKLTYTTSIVIVREVSRLRLFMLLAAVLGLLAGFKAVTTLAPANLALLTGPGIVVVSLGIARRLGLSWADLGFSRETWRKGAGYAGVAIAFVAAAYLVASLLPGTSSAFPDARYQIAVGSALLLALVIVPLHTVLLEEIAFRGVLLGMFRRPLGVVLSSALFGLWHVLPGFQVPAQNQMVTSILGTGVGAQVLTLAGTVLFTGAAGVLFCELRRRSGSVLASVGLHWATNGLGILMSALLWAAKAV